MKHIYIVPGSNNTNKLSPQELIVHSLFSRIVQIIQINLVLKNRQCYSFVSSSRSNNTNKLSPQEPLIRQAMMKRRSNNTNKLSPQEL